MIINELIKLASHLDLRGHHKEANYIDALVKRADEEDGEADEVEAKPSKWHRMKMSKVVDEMDKNDFSSLSFEINDYRIRITKVDKDD
jgi:hypothetical protein|tara:strand:- start:14291 stop:14554 length:264 start_codon:yes stop_codon:yes gene_type:complete